jgi:hypothetical protein
MLPYPGRYDVTRRARFSFGLSPTSLRVNRAGSTMCPATPVFPQEQASSDWADRSVSHQKRRGWSFAYLPIQFASVIHGLI